MYCVTYPQTCYHVPHCVTNSLQAAAAGAAAGGGPKKRLEDAVGWIKGLGAAATNIVGGSSRAADTAEDPEYIKVGFAWMWAGGPGVAVAV
jgi:ABC-type Fe3+ transport system substrate-binding protein